MWIEMLLLQWFHHLFYSISKTMYFAINPVDGNSLRESLFKVVTVTWRNKSEEVSAFNSKGSNYYWDCLKMKITYGCKIPLQNIL